MFGKKISDFYASIEDKWFAFLDKLDERGIPLYRFSDFFENKGIPSLLVVILIFCLIFLVFAWYSGVGGNIIKQELSFSFQDDFGNVLNSVEIIVTTSKGQELTRGLVNDGGKIILEGVVAGDNISVIASKKGYSSSSKTLILGKSGNNTIPLIKLNREIIGIDAKFRLFDNLTETPIQDAQVVISHDELNYNVTFSNGEYKAVGVPKDFIVFISIKVPGYEDFETEASFDGTSSEIFYLNPSNTSLEGKSSLLVLVKDDLGNALNDVKISVINYTTASVIDEKYSQEGRVVFSLPKNVSLQINASKTDYINFDSVLVDRLITLREDESTFEIELTQGGDEFTVVVESANGDGIPQAGVQVFSLDGVLLKSGLTDYSGEISFDGFSPSDEVFVTVEASGFVPLRQKFVVGSSPNVGVQLETSANGKILGVFVADSFNVPANNVDLVFWEILNGEKLPLGISSRKTDLSGYAEVVIPENIEVLVEAESENEEGKNSVVASGNNFVELTIRLKRKSGVVEFIFVDKYNRVLTGNVRVETTSGEYISDGNIYSGSFFAAVSNNESVKVLVETSDGNLFEEIVYVGNNESVKVVVDLDKESAIAPNIEFLGIVDAQGKDVEFVTPGEFYYLKFKLDFFDGVAGSGFHIRLGSDDSVYAEELGAGIFGFEAAVDNSIFSSSFSGNEAVDLANVIELGQMGRFLELYWNNPIGTKIVKVKIRVGDYSVLKNFDVKFRAWSEINGKYYRNPIDSILGEEEFNENKSKLYSSVLTETVLVKEFKSSDCENGICLSYWFEDEEGNVFDSTGFVADANLNYYFKVNIFSSESTSGSVSFVAEGPLTFLSKSSSFSGRLSGDSKSVSFNDVAFSVSGEREFSALFSGKEGVGIINFLFAGKDVKFERSISFDVLRKKNLDVSISPKSIDLGRDFSVRVLSESGDVVENASVKLFDNSGKLVKSVLGNGVSGKGLDGDYFFKNSLDAGIYAIEVSAENFFPFSTALIISPNNILLIREEELSVDLYSDKRTASVSTELFNNSGFDVSDIGFNISDLKYSVVDSDLPDELNYTITSPNALSGNQSSSIVVNFSYDGNSINPFSGELNIKFLGLVEGKNSVSADLKINVSYNKILEKECLVFSKPYVSVLLAGSRSSSTQEYVSVRNNCERQVSLRPIVRDNSRGGSGLNFNISPVTLNPGEEEEVVISVSNSFDRLFSPKEFYRFDVDFVDESLGFSKRLPVEVVISNPMFQLVYPPVIELFLTQSSVGESAFDSEVFPVSNVGDFDIEAISFAVNHQMASHNNVIIKIEPTGSVALLPKMASVQPIKVVQATSNSDKSLEAAVEADIIISGTLKNLVNRIGQQDYFDGGNNYNSKYGVVSSLGNLNNYDASKIYTGNSNSSNLQNGIYNNSYLGANQNLYNSANPNYYSGNTKYTNPISVSYPYSSSNSSASSVLGSSKVFVNVSGFQCLKVIDVEGLDFISSETGGGSLSRKIIIRNECAEELSILGLDKEFASVVSQKNRIRLVNLEGSTLRPMQQGEFSLVLDKDVDFSSNAFKLKVHGRGLTSFTSVDSAPFSININIGANVFSNIGKSIGPFEVDICGSDETKLVSFPKISKDDCGEGYCDSITASKYLVEKIDDYVNEFKTTVARKGINVNNYAGCQNQQSCSFSAVGLKPLIIDLYLMHDVVSSNVLEKSFIKTTNLQGFIAVGVASPDLENAKEIVSTGYANQLLFSDKLVGCGLYKLQVEGAVLVSNNDIQTDSVVVILKALGSDEEGVRILTSECAARIQNFSNFLPKSVELNTVDNGNTWLGSVSADDTVQSVASKFSSEWFNQDRTSALGGNLLNLSSGVVEEEGLIRIELDNSTQVSGVEPVVIDGIVNSFYTTSPNKDSLDNSIAKSLVAFSTNEANGCIASDESFFIIRDYDLTAKPTIKTDVPWINVQAGESCTVVKVSSEIGEILQVNTDWASKSIEQQNGVISIVVRESGNDVDLININSAGSRNGSSNSNLVFNLENTSSGLFEKELEVCAVFGEDSFIDAIGNSFNVWVVNPASNGARESNKQNIKFESSAINPNEFFSDLAKGNFKKGIYYALFSWGGEQSDFKVKDLITNLHQKNPDDFGIGIQLPDESLTSKSAIQNSFSGNGRISFLAACGLTSAVCNTGTSFNPLKFFGIGVISSIADVFLDCGVPYYLRFKDDDPLLASGIEHVVNSIEFIVKNAGELLGVDSWKNANFSKGLTESAIESVNVDNALLAGGVGISIKEAIDIYSNSWKINPASSAIVSKDLGKRVESILKAELSETMGTNEAESFARAYATDFSSNLKTKLDRAINQPNIKPKVFFKESANATLSETKISKIFSDIYSDISSTNYAQNYETELKGTVSGVMNDEAILNKITIREITGKGTAVSNTILSQVEFGLELNNIKLTATGKNLIISRFGLNPNANYTFKPKAVEKIYRNILAEIRNDPVQFLELDASDILKEEFSRKVSNSLITTANPNAKVSWLDRAKTSFKSIYKGSFWKNLAGQIGRGVACGAIANIAGNAALNFANKNKSTDKESNDIISKIDLKSVSDVEISKGTYYKIVVEENSGILNVVEIELVDTAEEIVEMQKAIKDGTAKLIKAKDLESLSKGLNINIPTRNIQIDNDNTSNDASNNILNDAPTNISEPITSGEEEIIVPAIIDDMNPITISN